MLESKLKNLSWQDDYKSKLVTADEGRHRYPIRRQCLCPFARSSSRVAN